jgi:hypothetical protein
MITTFFLRAGAGRTASGMPVRELTSDEDGSSGGGSDVRVGVYVCTDIDVGKGGRGIDAWYCWARTAGRRFRTGAGAWISVRADRGTLTTIQPRQNHVVLF